MLFLLSSEWLCDRREWKMCARLNGYVLGLLIVRKLYGEKEEKRMTLIILSWSGKTKGIPA